MTPQSSAVPGSPFARLGTLLPGAPTFTASAAPPGPSEPPTVLTGTATFLASQPFRRWGDSLHAKAFQ